MSHPSGGLGLHLAPVDGAADVPALLAGLTAAGQVRGEAGGAGHGDTVLAQLDIFTIERKLELFQVNLLHLAPV